MSDDPLGSLFAAMQKSLADEQRKIREAIFDQCLAAADQVRLQAQTCIDDNSTAKVEYWEGEAFAARSIIHKILAMRFNRIQTEQPLEVAREQYREWIRQWQN